MPNSCPVFDHEQLKSEVYQWRELQGTNEMASILAWKGSAYVCVCKYHLQSDGYCFPPIPHLSSLVLYLDPKYLRVGTTVFCFYRI